MELREGQVWAQYGAKYRIKNIRKTADGSLRCGLDNSEFDSLGKNSATSNYRVRNMLRNGKIMSPWEFIEDAGPLKEYKTIFCEGGCGAAFVLVPGDEYVSTCPECRNK